MLRGPARVGGFVCRWPECSRQWHRERQSLRGRVRALLQVSEVVNEEAGLMAQLRDLRS